MTWLTRRRFLAMGAPALVATYGLAIEPGLRLVVVHHRVAPAMSRLRPIPC